MEKEQSIEKFTEVDNVKLEAIVGGNLSLWEAMKKVNRNSRSNIINSSQLY